MGTAQAATAGKAGKKAPPKVAKAKANGAGGGAGATYPVSNKENPFREGSMKAKGWAIFAKGGERSKIVEAITKLGATPSTASSWCHTYQKYALSAEGPKKKAEKPAKPPKAAAPKKATAKTANGKASTEKK